MARNEIEYLGGLSATVTLLVLLLSPCVGAGDVKRTKMGGSIPGAPLSLAGATSTLAGASLIGSQDGTGATAGLKSPYGIATDGTSVYVADAGNHTIRRIAITRCEVTTLAGTPGSYGSTDGAGAPARFYKPFGLTTDGTSLYAADTFDINIRKID